MLENSKSIYFIKKLFAFVDEKIKLDIIKYNKNKVYELKHGSGYIKEYYADGKLKIEGEYLNGERNGKFKEYDSYGGLEFEGEYLNGQKNGKIKEYYKGKLEFEGEYLNNKEWIGIRYDDGNIKYKLNNKINLFTS